MRQTGNDNTLACDTDLDADMNRPARTCTPRTCAIRDSLDADLPAIAAIYAHHVRHSAGTFATTPPTLQELRDLRLTVLAHGMPWLVAVDDADAVLGYAYAAPYRPRPAYRHTLENSVYVRADQTGCGIGARLLAALIDRCTQGGWRQMVAVIGDSANTASIALHAAQGFRQAGTLHAVGYKHGRWLDTVIMQRGLGENES